MDQEQALREKLRAVVDNRWHCHSALKAIIPVHGRICREVRQIKSEVAEMLSRYNCAQHAPAWQSLASELCSLTEQLGLARQDLSSRMEVRSTAEDLVADAITELESHQSDLHFDGSTAEDDDEARLLQAVTHTLWYEQLARRQVQHTDAEWEYAQAREEAAYRIWQSERELDLGTTARDWARMHFEEGKIVARAAVIIAVAQRDRVRVAEAAHMDAREALQERSIDPALASSWCFDMSGTSTSA